MYFLPDLKFRLLVDVDMGSCLSVRGEEEGTIMDCDIKAVVELAVFPVPVIMSPVMDWLMSGGMSPTPAMLELSPEID